MKAPNRIAFAIFPINPQSATLCAWRWPPTAPREPFGYPDSDGETRMFTSRSRVRSCVAIVKWPAVISLVGACLVAGVASADYFDVTLGAVYSGNHAPANPGPLAESSFTAMSLGAVTLTLSG